MFGTRSSSAKIVSEGLNFDDVLLLPNLAQVHREKTEFAAVLHPKLKLKLPIISSPMDTVTETDMAIAMARHGGLGIIHRNLQIDKQVAMVKEVKKFKLPVGAAIGGGGDME